MDSQFFFLIIIYIFFLRFSFFLFYPTLPVEIISRNVKQLFFFSFLARCNASSFFFLLFLFFPRCSLAWSQRFSFLPCVNPFATNFASILSILPPLCREALIFGPVVVLIYHFLPYKYIYLLILCIFITFLFC